MLDLFIKMRDLIVTTVVNFFKMIFRRLDEFSSLVAVILLVISIIFLPKGLVLFVICALAMLLFIVPDTKFSKAIKGFFGNDE